MKFPDEAPPIAADQPEPTETFDVAVLGAGAAGLFAGMRAAERGRSTIVLEKNRRAGVKILMSGGTRCNLTNARGLRDMRAISGPIDPGYDPREARGARSIQRAFTDDGGAFLGPALKAFSVDRTVACFEGEGLATKVEANGKIFPATDRATDVLDVLVRRLERSGAVLRTSCPALQVEPTEAGFAIRTPGGTIRAGRVIVAVGGQSYPGSGTCGDGYAIARRFGHAIVEPRPALVPLRMDDGWVSELKGLTVVDVRARVEGVTIGGMERREALLFAHFGLTGPAILDVSRSVARHDGPGRPVLAIDFAPEATPEQLDGTIREAARSGRRPVAGLVPVSLPRRLTDALVAAAGIPAHRVGPELSRDERKRLVGTLKGLKLGVAGTLGFAKAEVTSGGVALGEVDPSTLQSRLQPGLHFVGEVLDLDGRIGGYNFQAAWSTGWLAGDSV